MKIEGTLKPVGTGSVGENRPRPQAGAQTPVSSDAKVELSSLSSSLNKAEAAMAETPAVDSKRVERIFFNRTPDSHSDLLKAHVHKIKDG